MRLVRSLLLIACCASCNQDGLTGSPLPDLTAATTIDGPPPADLISTCSDGVLDQDETGVDCGGATCPRCTDGRPCRAPTDCLSGQCSAGVCVSCTDGVRNGAETGVDCGGGTCPGCPTADPCLLARDCRSRLCAGGTCQPRPLTLSFAAAVEYTPGGYVDDVTTGDYDGDNKPDVAVLDRSHDVIRILAGQGNGLLGAVTNVDVGVGSLHGIATADFNRDGKDDLVVGGASAHAVYVLVQGKQPVTLAWPQKVTLVGVGDFTGDGLADVVAGSESASLVAVFPGDGKGGFAQAVESNLAGTGQALAVGDVNGDKRDDLVLAQFGAPLVVLLGSAQATLAAQYQYAPMNGYFLAVGAGRFGPGARMDVVGGLTSGLLLPFAGDGKGGFLPGASVAGCTAPLATTVADLDLDGVDDLAVACFEGDVPVRRGDGKGGLVAAVTTLPTRGDAVYGVAHADLDLDGKPDLVAIVAEARVLTFRNTSK